MLPLYCVLRPMKSTDYDMDESEEEESQAEARASFLEGRDPSGSS